MDRYTVKILPAGKTFSVQPGSNLRDILFDAGVEFPCGGHGRCGKCRVRLLQGQLPVTAADTAHFTAQELQSGWRLACQARVISSLTVEIEQWTTSFLIDQESIHTSGRDGCAIAVDLGTTTVAAQLLRLDTGQILSTVTALNNQVAFGADVVSRLEFALAHGTARLTQAARQQICGLIQTLLHGIDPGQAQSLPPVVEVVIVGNTAMHHFFCGLPVDSLAQYPFEPVDPRAKTFDLAGLGWNALLEDAAGVRVSPEMQVRFLPCIAGFVGADILAGIIATGLHRAPATTALVDLGTNGEMVVGDATEIFCASAAAGPAFEGARISCGMRAVTGAVAAVERTNDGVTLTTLGGVAPRGVCGSGLVDAIAVGLDLGIIEPSGRMPARTCWELHPAVRITPRDIREVQLAKAAIATGIHILARARNTTPDRLAAIHLAGAFGNYVRPESAIRIGMLPPIPDRIIQAGNTALRGAKMAFFIPNADLEALATRIRHVPLHTHPEFLNLFSAEMAFPPASC